MRPKSGFFTLIAGATMLFCSAGLAFAFATVGQPAPPLVAPELDGGTFDLAAMHGKVVIVNFWATWCRPCRAEMPALNAFYQRYHAQGLEMIGLSADRHHDRGDVIKVMQSLSYPAAMLENAKRNGFGSPTELPVTYVIDAHGVVRVKLTPNVNAVTETSLSAVVLPLLPNQVAGKSPNEGKATTPQTESNR